MQSSEDLIPIAKPWMDEREAKAAQRPILRGWVTQGVEVAAFEEEFAQTVGAKYACAVSSCTTAMHLALLAAGVGRGDEVITVSHSFIATANSIRYCGAKPVFVDIEACTLNMDSALVEQAITPRTKAILCVHQVGMPCDLRRLVEIASKFSLPLIEDAACAIGSEVLWNGEWERIGKPHGDIACFSFHPRKVITTGDGGMITTSRPDWDRQFRLWRQHGMSVPDSVRHSSRKVIFESYEELGYNYRMTDITAAVGREQLKRLPELVARRREIAGVYSRLLKDLPGLSIPEEPSWARSNWQSYCIRLSRGFSQSKFMQNLLDCGVSTRRGIMCAHREPAYTKVDWSCGTGAMECDCPEDSCKRLQQSESAQDEIVALPIYHTLSEANQLRVCNAVKECMSSQAHR